MEQRVGGSGSTAPTVLIEDPEGVVGSCEVARLEAAGFGVLVCSGPPPGMGFDCPVVAGARCPLADQADVVLFAPSDRTDRRWILEGLRSTRPDLPIIVADP